MKLKVGSGIIAQLCKVTMKILFLIPYPLAQAPSQRFRFEQYFGTLNRAGHVYLAQTFLNSHEWRHFSKSNVLIKSLVIVKGFFKRFLILFIIVPNYDRVFIHREATPIGPPIIEWIIAKVFRKKIIYDFDDAIWLTDRAIEPAIFRMIKFRSKVAALCRWSYRVSGGNEYLCNFARQYSSQVHLNPTTIDTNLLHHPALYKVAKKSGKVVIGWTGSYSTLKYLEALEPVLIELEQKYYHLEFLIIADRKPQLGLKNLRFVPWSVDSEITSLLESDIGIMPLPDDEWAQGKCGFKALQYMALEIPAVVSPVGVNTSIVDHGVNGFFCTTPQEWIQYLSILIEDKFLREQMGKQGRQKVIDQFSVDSNKDNFLSLFS